MSRISIARAGRLLLALAFGGLAAGWAPQAAAASAPAAAKPAAAKPAADPPPEPMDTTPLPANAERIDHGRFSEVDVYKPQGTPGSFVLLLTGEDGWTPQAVATAQALVQKGAMVAGTSLPRFRRMLEAQAGTDCEYIAGDFENLSHFVQAYYKLPDYLPPIVVALGAGGALGYAELAEGPEDATGGALLLGFKPGLSLRKPLCPGWALATERHADNKGYDVLPAKAVSIPLTLFTDAAGETAAKPFVGNLGQASAVTLPAGGAGVPPAFLEAYDKLAASLKPSAPAAPADLGGLPVIEVPPKSGVSGPDAFAILISGDGGWAGLDQEVAGALSAHGIPVVGLDSLRYFWTARTPESAAADTDKLIRYYLDRYKKSQVLLLGYSQGADVMPFIINRLPPETRRHVALGAVMGLSEHALFEFHMGNWVSANQDQGLPTAPEMEKAGDMPGDIPMLCIYGEGETDTLCPKLNPQKVHVVKLPGGHHFGGDYQRLAREILSTAKLPVATAAALPSGQTSGGGSDQSGESKEEEGSTMLTFHVLLTPLLSLIAGILILLVPRLLNYIVAIYLIVIGALGLFPHLH